MSWLVPFHCDEGDVVLAYTTWLLLQEGAFLLGDLDKVSFSSSSFYPSGPNVILLIPDLSSISRVIAGGQGSPACKSVLCTHLLIRAQHTLCGQLNLNSLN